MKFIIHHINQWLLNRSFNKAKAEADKEHSETGRKVFVILYDRDFVAITKKRMKRLRALGRLSDEQLKGIEKRAVYTAQ